MPKEVTVPIHTYGTEQVKGRRARKVAREHAAYLEQYGWVIARDVGYIAYARMYPPADSDVRRPQLTIIVPTEEEVMALALQLHAAARPWRGELSGWPAKYTPRKAHQGQRNVTEVGVEVRSWVEAYEWVNEAQFEVGVSLLWRTSVTWDDGDDRPPRVSIHTDT